MENIKTIAGINLLVLLIYMGLINVSSTGAERELAVLLIAAFVIVFHVVLNLLIALVLFIRKNKQAKSFLLSAFIVLVIGFSTCLGSTAI